MKKIIISLLMVTISSSAFASAELAKSKSCMACHSIDKKVVGPSFKDIAKRYNTGDEAKLANKVIKGSSGNWGFVPMPPNATVNEKEAQILVQWIMSNK